MVFSLQLIFVRANNDLLYRQRAAVTLHKGYVRDQSFPELDVFYVSISDDGISFRFSEAVLLFVRA